MRYLKYAVLLGLLLAVSGAMAGTANAQVRFGIGIGVGPGYYYGPAPVCAFGYYPYYPYACAPYGYYGPDWFVNGVFIGAGPWFHGFWGRPGFYGRGFYGRGYYGHGFYGRPGFRDFDGRPEFRGDRDFRTFHGGDFRGGSLRGEGGFHSGGGFHGGGGHGGGHR